MKFAICNEIFQGWNIEAVIDFCAALGYDAIEIAPFTLAPRVGEMTTARRARVRTAADARGMTLCGLHWLLARTEGFCLTSADPAVRRRTSDYLCELVECCVDLGGRTLVLGSPQQRTFPASVRIDQAWEFATETLFAAVERSAARGAVICIEPLAPSETNFLNTAAEAIRFARQFKNDAVKIVLDVKAMCSETAPIPQIIRDCAGEFAHFHANDKNLKGPGFGETDFRPIASALSEVGYNGFVSVEVFNFEDGPEKIARASLEYLQQVF